ncbi:unnamed protein product [Phaedon cochleariae]|uniref:Crossover junction endonuclease MUS81 n=1 Tax=Phaedon cochleariae TaxID=80249 RepID=A0A9P0DN04_PHACE|nr:unnamed protein product [Phaedon cochleariae]
MDCTKRRRVTVKFKSANPLFEQWLAEWEEKAKIKGSKSHHTFQKALTYLRKCPIPLNSGKECLILKGFGEKLCQMLDRKLQEHSTSTNVDNDVHPIISNKDDSNRSKTQGLPENTAGTGLSIVRRKGENKESSSSSCESDGSLVDYMPIPRTGEYAILLALYKKHMQPNYPGYSTKQEIISEAIQFSDISFTKLEGKRTAWFARKTLISRKLLTEKSKPLKYSLTDSGISLAKKLYDENYSNANNNKESLDENPLRTIELGNIQTWCQAQSSLHNDEISDEIIIFDGVPPEVGSSIGSVFSAAPLLSKQSDSVSKLISKKGLPSQKSITKHPSTSSTTSTKSQSQEECVIFQPGSYDIILYVDTAETTGNHGKSKSDAFLAELSNLMSAGSYEVKHLSVGDFIWICRDKSTKKELVLPYVVERKRLDDLAGSIKDGRYHEQKFRLKRSGAQTKIYLIEQCAGARSHVGLPLSTLMQAAANTAVQDGFVVSVTGGLKQTAEYLSRFTGLLAASFKDKTVMSCPKDNLDEVDLTDDLIPLMTFNEFNRSSMKNKPMKVTDLFVKMLLQLKGISVDRALAIVEIYPTPATLRQAYSENTGIKGEKLLAPIKFGKFKKAIGPTLSKTIYQLFTSETFS